MSPSETGLPLAHWSLFRHRLLWAYDRKLNRQCWEWPYVPYPVAAWLVRSGSVTLRFASGEESYPAGTWIFPKEEEAAQAFAPGTELLSIRFQAEWCYGVPVLDHSRTIAFPAREAPGLTRDAETLVTFVREHFPDARLTTYVFRGDFGFYLELQPVLMRWISSYYATLRARGARAHSLETLDRKVLNALHLIETRPLDLPLHGGSLARDVGCSVSQLNKLFSREIGKTPAALWNRRKLVTARSDLRRSSASIKSIAYSVGFSSAEHFCHWFKRHTGRSPSEFRRIYADIPS